MSPVAFLSGVNIVRDACNHEVIGKYIHKVQFEELMQTLDLPMDELEKFAGDVLERFDNPYVDHQVTSIMLNSFPKFQARDLPGVKTFLERKGELPKGLVFGLAAIITYYKGGVEFYSKCLIRQYLDIYVFASTNANYAQCRFQCTNVWHHPFG